MKSIVNFFLVVAFSVISFSAYAEERGTREEAKALVEKSVAYFKKHGAEALFKKINSQDKEYKFKDLYVFVDDLKGINFAHGAKPHIVGADHSKIKDITGKYLVLEMIELVKKGKTGWVDYKWPDSISNKISQKSSYISPLGDKYLVGVGVYVK